MGGLLVSCADAGVTLSGSTAPISIQMEELSWQRNTFLDSSPCFSVEGGKY